MKAVLYLFSFKHYHNLWQCYLRAATEFVQLLHEIQYKVQSRVSNCSMSCRNIVSWCVIPFSQMIQQLLDIEAEYGWCRLRFRFLVTGVRLAEINLQRVIMSRLSCYQVLLETCILRSLLWFVARASNELGLELQWDFNKVLHQRNPAAWLASIW